MATASLTLTLANKERLASVGATMSASDVDSVRRLLTDELDILTTVCADTEALALVRQRVLTGDFFPDAPVTAAQLQARAWFSASPTAHALAVILISANHPTAPETATLLSEVTVSALTAPFLLANLGAAAVRAGRPGEARVAYRKASVLLGAASAEPNEHTQIRLRAHLYLGNQDAAMQALTALCIGLDDSRNVDATMRRLEQQAHACNAIGLTNSFADLLLRSPHWGLLQPLGLAMKLLSGDDQLLLAAPFEVQQMAREVAERLST